MVIEGQYIRIILIQMWLDLVVFWCLIRVFSEWLILSKVCLWAWHSNARFKTSHNSLKVKTQDSLKNRPICLHFGNYCTEILLFLYYKRYIFLPITLWSFCFIYKVSSAYGLVYYGIKVGMPHLYLELLPFIYKLLHNRF